MKQDQLSETFCNSITDVLYKSSDELVLYFEHREPVVLWCTGGAVRLLEELTGAVWSVESSKKMNEETWVPAMGRVG